MLLYPVMLLIAVVILAWMFICGQAIIRYMPKMGPDQERKYDLMVPNYDTGEYTIVQAKRIARRYVHAQKRETVSAL